MRGHLVKYAKPPLTLQQQVALLVARGMAGDPALMLQRLSVVNYYRLSGYWHPFKQSDSSFHPGTNFDAVWRRYVFDRKLRLLVIDAIERIEVTVRTQLAYLHALTSGDPFAYAVDQAALPGLNQDDRDRFLYDLQHETSASKETFAEHFRNRYGDQHAHMPVWMAAEVMTFGCMLTFYRGSPPQIKKDIAAVFGVHDVVLSSWLFALNVVRNVCAHHGRLWNRELRIKPKIPDRNLAWHQPVEIDNSRLFGVMTLCKHCLNRVAPQSHWPDRWHSLLREFPDVPRRNMGMPDNWQNCPIWH